MLAGGYSTSTAVSMSPSISIHYRRLQMKYDLDIITTQPVLRCDATIAFVLPCLYLAVQPCLLPSMSSSRYAPLPNPQTDPLLNDEMEAAFEDDDDDDEHAESHPLNPAPFASSVPHTPTHGVYDFENFDYASLPPPGSPPRPSSLALPNDIGNSNGSIPSPTDVRHVDEPRSGWFRRTARSVLPSSLHHRLHLDYEPTPGVVGGGTHNDGVFANVTAKPSRPVQLREGPPCFLSFSFHFFFLLALTSNFIHRRRCLSCPRRVPEGYPTLIRLSPGRRCATLLGNHRPCAILTR